MNKSNRALMVVGDLYELSHRGKSFILDLNRAQKIASKRKFTKEYVERINQSANRGGKYILVSEEETIKWHKQNRKWRAERAEKKRKEALGAQAQVHAIASGNIDKLKSNSDIAAQDLLSEAEEAHIAEQVSQSNKAPEPEPDKKSNKKGPVGTDDKGNIILDIGVDTQSLEDQISADEKAEEEDNDGEEIDMTKVGEEGNDAN